MKIFITGINSFVGKTLVSKLKKYKKYKIFGCDLAKNKIKNFVTADIRDKNFYKKLPKKIDVIIHLAAISRDKDCADDLSECYLTNVVGTLNVLKAAKALNIKNIIFASTEWVYPNEIASKGVNEKTYIDISKLNSEYAKSKLLSELHLKNFYSKNKNFNISILRFGIIYGERYNNWSAVEAIFNSVRKNNHISVGSLKTSRKFIHIDDIAYGIIKSLKLKKFNIVNLQGNKLVTLKYLIQISRQILKKKFSAKEKDKKNPSIRNVQSKISNKKLKFVPKISLKKGLIRLHKYLNKL